MQSYDTWPFVTGVFTKPHVFQHKWFLLDACDVLGGGYKVTDKTDQSPVLMSPMLKW